MEKKVIAIVGLAGTGKSIATEYSQKKYNLESIYFGGFVLKEVQKRGLEITSNNERIVREDLRIMYGMDIMAKLAHREIKTSLKQNKNVIIDGLYSFSEYTFLKQLFKERLILIAIHADKEIRYHRLMQREIRPLNTEEVDKRDYLEITMIEKGGPIAIADFHILNNKSENDLFTNIDIIFNNKLFK